MRKVIAALMAAGALGVAAAPALAQNTGPPPPPYQTGSANGANVYHCVQFPGDGHSTVVFNNGTSGISGGGSCSI